METKVETKIQIRTRTMDMKPVNPQNVILLPKGELRLSNKALSHIMALQQVMNGREFGFKTIGERRGRAIINIWDIFVPSQVSNGGYFETTNQGYVEVSCLTRQMKTKYLVGWGHSHGFITPGHSGLDVKTDFSHIFLYKLPVVSLTVGDQLTDWDARIYIRLNGKKFTYVDAKIVFPYDVSNDVKRIVHFERPKTRIVFEAPQKQVSKVEVVEEPSKDAEPKKKWYQFW